LYTPDPTLMMSECSLSGRGQGHVSKGVVVNFDLGGRFPRPRFQQRGSLRPRAQRVAVLGWVREGVTPGIFLEVFDAKSRVWGQFGPENKLIEGQPNECTT